MKPTNVKFFADSNVLLYLLSDERKKKEAAIGILKANPIISTQVISENVCVLVKKFRHLDLSVIKDHVFLLKSYCTVVPLTMDTINKAIEIRERYGFQWYDATILSAALLSECSIIYSEDMQNNQLVFDDLKIVNPFI